LLKTGNREAFGDIKRRKHNPLGIINALDIKEEYAGLTEAEFQQKMEAKADWAKISLTEEISWRQKSRALWLQAGDRNTKFFHRIANTYRRFNSLSSIEVEGVCYDTLPDMKSAIQGFYKSLFTESEQ